MIVFSRFSCCFNHSVHSCHFCLILLKKIGFQIHSGSFGSHVGCSLGLLVVLLLLGVLVLLGGLLLLGVLMLLGGLLLLDVLLLLGVLLLLDVLLVLGEPVLLGMLLLLLLICCTPYIPTNINTDTMVKNLHPAIVYFQKREHPPLFSLFR